MARFSCASACSLAGLSLLHSRAAFKRNEALGFRGAGCRGFRVEGFGFEGVLGLGFRSKRLGLWVQASVLQCLEV